MKPRPYQEALLSGMRGKSALNSSDVGTGKTATTVWALLDGPAPERVLIVAPQATYYGWERTVKAIAKRELHRVDTKAAGKRVYEALTAGQSGWYFIPWSTLTAWNKRRAGKRTASVTHPLGGTHWDCLVLDEVHRAANKDTLNFQVASRIKRDRTLALSATPAGNTPVNIYGALKLTWPDNYGGFNAFAEASFKSYYNPYSDSAYSRLWGDEFRPGAVRKEAPCWVGVRAADVLADMPEVVEEVREVSMTRAQAKVYREWKEEALTWLDDNPVATELPVVKYTRLRQALLGELSYDWELDRVEYAADCKSPKLDALLEILGDQPPGEPVLVWVHSQRFMTPLLARLKKAGYSALEVSGKSDGDFRDFIAGKYQVLCAVPAALAEGTDGLQTVCRTEVWLSDPDNFIIAEQAKGRLVRSGQTRSVMRYRIQVPKSVDGIVLGNLAERGEALAKSNFI